MEHVTHGITLHGIARFVDIATDALSAAREEIDALNVYPVPDGDTGTNMFLTVSAARDGLREAMAADPGIELPEAMTVLARAALLGARGNSGVILSQMLRAFVRQLAAAKAEDRRADVMATAMSAATDASYAAVGTPVEGTILSVARAASDAALEAASEPSRSSVEAFQPPLRREAVAGGSAGPDRSHPDTSSTTAYAESPALASPAKNLRSASPRWPSTASSIPPCDDSSTQAVDSCSLRVIPIRASRSSCSGNVAPRAPWCQPCEEDRPVALTRRTSKSRATRLRMIEAVARTAVSIEEFTP